MWNIIACQFPTHTNPNGQELSILVDSNSLKIHPHDNMPSGKITFILLVDGSRLQTGLGITLDFKRNSDGIMYVEKDSLDVTNEVSDARYYFKKQLNDFLKEIQKLYPNTRVPYV